jgi:hypothetical protein
MPVVVGAGVGLVAGTAATSAFAALLGVSGSNNRLIGLPLLVFLQVASAIVACALPVRSVVRGVALAQVLRNE